ncbi:HAD family hydrolase [Pseudoxanthomonas beigongshangi]
MNLALFDFDGTLTVREMMPGFMHAAVAPTRLAVGKILLAPWVLGYRAGWVSGNRVRASIVDFGFRGVPEARLQAAGRAFANDVLPGVLREDAMTRLHWHRARGDTVVVVSGGLETYLSHWCQAHDLELVCSRLEVRDGRMTGRYHGAQCVGEEKVRRIRERYDLSRYERIHAYGDTHEDHAMLGLAHEAWYRGQPWQR